MKKGIIISGNLAQDHEFIYPYYRLLEEEFLVVDLFYIVQEYLEVLR